MGSAKKATGRFAARRHILISTTNQHARSHSAFSALSQSILIACASISRVRTWYTHSDMGELQDHLACKMAKGGYFSRARRLSTHPRVTPTSLRHPRPSEWGVCVWVRVVWSFNRQHTTVTSLNYNQPFKIAGANESDDFHGRRSAWRLMDRTRHFLCFGRILPFLPNPLAEQVAAS